MLVATQPQLPLFSALPLSSQLRVVTTLETMTEIYQQVIQENKSVRNNSAVIWAALKRYGLIPPSNFFDKIQDEDVIEVYSSDHHQMFANFRFFELCSYTLEQVYSLPWDQLWYRDPAALQVMHKAVHQILSTPGNTAIPLEEPPHRVKELASPFKFELDYQIKCIAPLTDKVTHQKAAYIAIEEGVILNEPSPEEQERMLLEFFKLSPTNHLTVI